MALKTVNRRKERTKIEGAHPRGLPSPVRKGWKAWIEQASLTLCRIPVKLRTKNGHFRAFRCIYSASDKACISKFFST
jgi:hypothetical protein